MKCDEGFTLLESLVSLTIIALLLLMLSQTLGASIFQTKKNMNAVLAASLSRSLFAEFGIIHPIKPGVVDGNIKNIGKWQATISKHPTLINNAVSLKPKLHTFNILVTITIESNSFDFSSTRSTSYRNNR